MTIHFIYVKGNSISTPFAITNEVEIRLKKHFNVKVYNWQETITIVPNEGDVLLGHPYPSRKTIFRKSMKQKGWKRIISLNPYAHNILENVAFLDHVYDYIDTYIAITGEYWYDNMPEGPFSYFYPITKRIDLGINRIHFPQIKFTFNQTGKRKFLYIGNTIQAKGTDYLAKISLACPEIEFGWIGQGEIKNSNLIPHGMKDTADAKTKQLIASYDFIIAPGRSDANPTTILEGASWGLIPVCTQESGYYNKTWIFNIPLDKINETARIIQELNNKNEEELLKIQKVAIKEIEKTYNWDLISNQIIEIINSPAPIKTKLKIKDKIKRKKIQLINLKNIITNLLMRA